jgi:DhnA family fructose-bisphosphate aldolase class Ia
MRGGEKGEEEEVIATAQRLLDAGASGLVYGRYIYGFFIPIYGFCLADEEVMAGNFWMLSGMHPNP